MHFHFSLPSADRSASPTPYSHMVPEMEKLLVAAKVQHKGHVNRLRRELREERQEKLRLRSELAAAILANEESEANATQMLQELTASHAQDLMAMEDALARCTEEIRRLKRSLRCANDFTVVLSETVVNDRLENRSTPYSFAKKVTNWGKKTCVHEDAENGRCTNSLSCKIGCSICRQPLCPAHIYHANDPRVTDRGHAFCSGCVVKMNGALAIQSSISVALEVARYYGVEV